MKLIPTMKLIGKLIVSFIIKFTLVCFELFCMPIIKSKNKDKLNPNAKSNFLIGMIIYLFSLFGFNINHKLYFS